MVNSDWTVCPYDSSHHLLKLRIQSHIMKCEKRHPELKFVACPFNATHRLRKEDMIAHFRVCESKPLPKPLVVYAPHVRPANVIADSEDWD